MSATAADVGDVFAHAQHADAQHADERCVGGHDHPDRAPTGLRVLRRSSGRPALLDDACVWWGNLVPVATTGWGALVLIAPLLVAGLLLRTADALRRGA